MDEPILDDDFSGDSGNALTLSDVRFAGFWIRVGASLLDSIILLPIIGLGIYNSISMKSLPLMFLLSVLSTLYKPYLEWKKSATLGKLAVGIKVIDRDVNPIDLDQAIKRYFPWIISFIISMILNISLYTNPDFQEAEGFLEMSMVMQESPLNSINSAYGLIFFILVGSLAFDARKQGVHDKYAKTYCIYK